jgi:23S rRNA (adenine2503-C2)-methyltransferase
MNLNPTNPPAEDPARRDHILKGKTVQELSELFRGLGEPAYRGKQAFGRINRLLAATLDDFTEFPISLRNRLKELNAFPSLKALCASADPDGTEKSLFETTNRKGEPIRIETVWLVSEERRTICVSSQAGCSLNCSFCATATIPFAGNLNTWQILDQIYELIRRHNERPTNIVFMGMGEPFYNYESVLRAAHTLNDPEGINLSARSITISTAGVVPNIRRFTHEGHPFNLAISLNHPDAAIRGTIMDVEGRHPLSELLDAVRDHVRASGRPVTFEYVCIPGLNMAPNDAEKLIRIARRIHCKINLIPLNTTFDGRRPPSEREMLEFQNHLKGAGILAFNRGSAGRGINGACGMLALQG